MTISQTFTVIVDADACPVKTEICETSAAFEVPVVMVASYDHILKPFPGVEIVQVDRSDQSADMYIANRIRRGDLLITQDFGLASIVLGKGAYAMGNRGQMYTHENIDFLLARRHESAKLRRSGKYTKGPKSFTEEDRQIFLHRLTKTLQALQEKTS